MIYLMLFLIVAVLIVLIIIKNVNSFNKQDSYKTNYLLISRKIVNNFYCEIYLREQEAGDCFITDYVVAILIPSKHPIYGKPKQEIQKKFVGFYLYLENVGNFQGRTGFWLTLCFNSWFFTTVQQALPLVGLRKELQRITKWLAEMSC